MHSLTVMACQGSLTTQTNDQIAQGGMGVPSDGCKAVFFLVFISLVVWEMLEALLTS